MLSKRSRIQTGCSEGWYQTSRVSTLQSLLSLAQYEAVLAEQRVLELCPQLERKGPTRRCTAQSVASEFANSIRAKQA